MKVKYPLLFFIFSVSISFGQDKVEIDNSKTGKVSEIYSFSRPTSNYLLLSQVQQNSSSNLQIRAQSSTVIQQIGNQNNAAITSDTNNLFADVLQRGNNNNILSESTILVSTERIIQNGNNNNYLNYSFGNVSSSSINLLQNGNNQTFEKFGTNSLTNNIALTITGDNRTVIIRSF